MEKSNREMIRFAEHVGGNTKASKIFGCNPDMVRKMKVGDRGVNKSYVQAMYRYKGFRLSFLRLFDLD